MFNIGAKFHSLTLMEPYTRLSKIGKPFKAWICLCDCGKTHNADEGNLKSGIVKHCKSCSAKKKSSEHKTHGMSGYCGKDQPKIYYTWRAMKQRCLNQQDKSYHDYGGRGITVCERWKNSFEAFMEDIGLPPTPLHSIERVNVNGNYEPGNVIWATPKEQGNNKRNNIVLTHNGKTQTLPEWCDELGIDYSRSKRRFYKSGGDVDYTLSHDDYKKGIACHFTVDGERYETLREVSEKFSMSISGCHTRFKSKTYPNWVRVGTEKPTA